MVYMNYLLKKILLKTITGLVSVSFPLGNTKNKLISQLQYFLQGWKGEVLLFAKCIYKRILIKLVYPSFLNSGIIFVMSYESNTECISTHLMIFV